MPVFGKGKKKVLVYGEAPGAEEDKFKKPFVGKAGQYLQRVLRRIGVELFSDCWVGNALRCRPVNNLIKDERAIDYCRPFLIQAVDELKPEVIIPLGAMAVKSVIGWLWKENPGAVARWVGWQIPVRTINTWVTPTYHPSFIIREEEGRSERKLLDLFFEQHLKDAFSLEGRPWDKVPDPKKGIRIIHNQEEAAAEIRKFIGEKPSAFDYETDRGKPDHKNATILTCAISDGKRTIAYPWLGQAVEATKEYLISNTPKVGWNVKFEDRWSRKVLGVETKNFVWDGMLAAHALDSRPGTKSLKFQSFVLLGAESYDDGLKPYMETKNNNQKNRLREVDLDRLLLYNGLDALYEYQCAKFQSRQMGVRL
jgi:uracil-DNA glycosylase family 4